MNYNILKEKKLKITNQRKLILSIIYKLENDASVKNILKECNNKIDKSTIYRILDVFLRNDIIEKKININNEIYYEIIENHVHYFKCVMCHKKEKINICPIENIFNEKTGYLILSHSILINGICKECNKKQFC